jgi:Fur family ferric uptake transcriptional regulator
LLLDANIVVRLSFTSTNVQYRLKCIAEQRHYTICTSCGTVNEIKNNKINNCFSGFKTPKFTAEYHTLYFYGICSRCKYRQQYNGRKNKK